MTDQKTRRRLARLSLSGLSIGDAFGQQFCSQPELLPTRTLPVYPWTFTDDTVMGIAVTQTLELCGEIDQDDLANRFSTFYSEDPFRGYGDIAHKILRKIAVVKSFRRGLRWNRVNGKRRGNACRPDRRLLQ